MPTTPQPSPDEIYVRAVAAARAEPVPPAVTYRLAYRASGAAVGCLNGRIVVSFGACSTQGAYLVPIAPGTAPRAVDATTGQSCTGVLR